MTVRAVEAASMQIAAKHGNDYYAIPLSRLSEIETKGVLPSLYRLYSLSIIYRRDLRDLLNWYGIDLDEVATDMGLVDVPKSHRVESFNTVTAAQMPVRLAPSFDPRMTMHLGRMVEEWGVVPLSFLAPLAASSYTYAYVGTEDFTMYPLLLPGSFVQVDESKSKVTEDAWRSEYERPIYFVETRDGFTCCWCSVASGSITLQPHPLSPVPVRVLKHPREAEIIGEVVGVAMRLRSCRKSLPVRGPHTGRMV